MADQPLTLDEVKNSLRISHNLDDGMLKNYLSAATLQIEKAITNDESLYESLQLDTRFKIAVSMLVSEWYENRMGLEEKHLREIPDGIISFVHTLRSDYPCISQI
ncbi:head-tail connector protein [Heyndrickxia coagulans]|uniref:head-tail connector protein n=1 Tax=Heyndrickxia coagulans TaxID=1398 RepID=UPI002E05D600|nr:head-tail connector protein [Heyndrickxia coagulans]MEC5268268.1 head-tail connector protein [Heyndrickxia coagulans]